MCKQLTIIVTLAQEAVCATNGTQVHFLSVHLYIKFRQH
jgi:hypothetical protein